MPRRTIAPPVPSTADVLAQLARSGPPTPPPAAEPAPTLSPEQRQAAIDLALREILSESDAAFRTIPVLYQDFLVRCRIRRVGGEPLSLFRLPRRLAVAHAGIDLAEAEAEDSPWAEVLGMAGSLPDDMQGVFLSLARAAFDRRPCPSDAEVARAYGSRSPGGRGACWPIWKNGSHRLPAGRAGRRIVAIPALRGRRNGRPQRRRAGKRTGRHQHGLTAPAKHAPIILHRRLIGSRMLY